MVQVVFPKRSQWHQNSWDSSIFKKKKKVDRVMDQTVAFQLLWPYTWKGFVTSNDVGHLFTKRGKSAHPSNSESVKTKKCPAKGPVDQGVQVVEGWLWAGTSALGLWIVQDMFILPGVSTSFFPPKQGMNLARRKHSELARGAEMRDRPPLWRRELRWVSQPHWIHVDKPCFVLNSTVLTETHQLMIPFICFCWKCSCHSF